MMIAIVWPFLAGLGVGGVMAWIILSLNATADPAHAVTEQREGWSVHSIAARVERERAEASCDNRISDYLRCG